MTFAKVVLGLVACATSACAVEMTQKDLSEVGWRVTSVGEPVFDGTDTTFEYEVSVTAEEVDLSHWGIELWDECANTHLVSFEGPNHVYENGDLDEQLGYDPTTMINGVKWDEEISKGTTTRYYLKLSGNVPKMTVDVKYAVKGSDYYAMGKTTGPQCKTLEGPVCQASAQPATCAAGTGMVTVSISNSGSSRFDNQAWTTSLTGATADENNIEFPIAGNCATGPQKATLTLDGNGATATCEADYSYTDTAGPTLSARPRNLTVEPGDVPDQQALTATDACEGSINVVMTNTEARGIIIYTWTATDSCSNTVSHSQTISVVDTVKPAMAGVEASQTVSCDVIPPPCDVTAFDASQETTVVTFSETHTQGPCAYTYDIVRTWSASDASGNTATEKQTISVEDNAAPILVGVPSNIAVECGQIPPAPTVTADDHCDPNVSVTFSETRGAASGRETTSHDYTLVRTWTAVDACGNSAMQTQTISVSDTQAPVLSGVDGHATARCSAVPPPCTVEVTDACDVDVEVLYSTRTNAGSCEDEYEIVRTWSSQDVSGNNASESQTITIIDGVAPDLSGVPDYTTLAVQCDDIPTYNVAATDNCGGPVTLNMVETKSNEVNGKDNAYDLTRVWTASDRCGNTVEFTLTLSVSDNQNPELVGLPGPTLSTTCGSVPAAPTVTASDNCCTSMNVNFVEVRTDGSCADTYTLTRTWSVNDCDGNNASFTQTINVQDNTAPVCSGMPGNLNLPCDNPDLTWATLTCSDDCAATATIAHTETTQAGGCDDEYSLVRVWSVTDDCGNAFGHTQTISVHDSEKPTISGIPSHAELTCEEDPDESFVVTASDTCSNPTLVSSDTVENGDCVWNFVTTRNYVATDACGNFETGSYRLRRYDIEPPVLTVTVDKDGNYVAEASDNCATNPQILHTTNRVDGACSDNYHIVDTWSVSDDCGLSDAHSETISTNDTTAPTLTCGANCDGNHECDQAVAAPTVTADDNSSVTCVPVRHDGACADAYDVVYTCRASDECSNQGETTVTHTFSDSTAPELTNVPTNDVTLECGEPAPTDPNVGATDNCDNSPVVVRQVSAVGQATTWTWTATDNCGNSVSDSFTFTYVDTTPPTISCPQAETRECDDVPSPPSVHGSDTCGPVTTTHSELSSQGSCDGAGTNTHTWTVVDGAGNTNSCSQVVTIVDTTPPTLTGAPIDLTLGCDEPVPAAVEPANSDNCGGSVAVDYDQVKDLENGSSYRLTRTWTGTDTCGNTHSVDQTITVQDTENPSLTVPSSVSGTCTEPSLGDASATDNCGDATITSSDLNTAGVCDYEYQVVRTYVATDDQGLTATGKATITVSDNGAPVIDDSQNPSGVTTSVEWASGIDPVAPALTATDGCEGVIQVTTTPSEVPGCGGTFTRRFDAVAADTCGNQDTWWGAVEVVDTTPPAFSVTPGNLDLDCTEPLPGPPSTVLADAADFETYTQTPATATNACTETFVRRWVINDACDNQDVHSQTITVTDTTPPVLSIPADTQRECDATYTPPAPTATDDCHTVSIQPSSSSDADHNYFTWAASDSCGNAAAPQTQTVTIVDTTPPVISAPADSSTSHRFYATCEAADATADDTCSTPTVTCSELRTDGTCIHKYTMVRTYTATDSAGNTSTDTETVTIDDTTPPTLHGVPSDLVFSFSDVAGGIPRENPLVTATDDETLSNDPTFTVGFTEVRTDTGAQAYTLVRTWDITDRCGNADTGVQTIIVNDDTPPVLPIPNDYTVECSDDLYGAPHGSIDAIEVQIKASFADANTVLTRTDTKIDGTCPNEYKMVHEWTATDVAGNSFTDSFTITVVDTASPTWSTALPPVNTETQCTHVDPGAVTAEDACAANGNASGEVTVTRTETITNNGVIPYTVSYVYTATDACGHFITYTATTQVRDTQPATLVNKPDADANAECAEPALPTPGADDNCGNASVQFTEGTKNYSCGEAYTFTRTWTAKDSRGNVGESFTQTVRVTDTTDPEFVGTLPADTTAQCSAPPADTLTANDACAGALTVTVSSDLNSNPVTYTWVASDNCGNGISHTQRITLADTTPPAIGTPPPDATLDCGAALPVAPQLDVVENCGVGHKATAVPATVPGCGNTKTVTYTWSFADESGNLAPEVQQVITFVDTTPPVIQGSMTKRIYECGDAVPAFVQPTVQDDCDASPSLVHTDQLIENKCASDSVRTFTATDACGNTASAAQTIAIVDSTPPTISVANAIFPCNNVGADPEPVVDDCNTHTETVTETPLVPNGCNWVKTRVHTSTDSCGNDNSATSTVTIYDDDAPVFSNVPGPSSYDCAFVPPAPPSATDECEGGILVPDGTEQDIGSGRILTTWTVTDSCGNSATATQTTTVQDTEAPQITGEAQDGQEQCEVSAKPNLQVTDNCPGNPILEYNQVITGDSCNAVYTRTWTAYDASTFSNPTVRTQTVTVADTTAPVWDTPLPPTTYTFDCTTGTIQAPTASDNCDGSSVYVGVSESDLSSTNPNIVRYYTRTYTVTDSCGNSNTFTQTITVSDDTAPVLTVSRTDRSFRCDEIRPPVSATYTDPCGTVTLTPTVTTTPGSCDGNYIQTHTFTAADQYGNSATSTVTDTVTDTAAPVLTVPNSATFECFATARPAPTAEDVCEGQVEVTTTSTVVAGSCDAASTTTYHYSATDTCGNVAEETRTVTVTDTGAPNIEVLPASGAMECDDKFSFPDAEASDDCGGEVVVARTLASSTQTATPCDYVETWEYSATDACGHTSTASFALSVVDTTPPTLTGGAADASFQCEADEPVAPTVADNCDESPTLDYSSVNNVRTWTATDRCGHTSTHVQVVTVADTTPPELVVSRSDDTVQCDAVPVLYDGIAAATDNCDNDPAVACVETRADGACAHSYQLTRTCIATDSSGNDTEDVHIVYVQDTTNPTFEDFPADVSKEYCDHDVSADPLALDNCGSATVSSTTTDVTGNCAHNFERKTVYTAQDECGNTSSRTWTVTVVDTTPPVLSHYPEDVTVECDSVPVKCEVHLVTDCDGLSDGSINYDETQSGNVITRTWSALDACGNAETHTQTITLQDTTAPLLSRKPEDVTVGCDCDTFPGDVEVRALDNCDTRGSWVVTPSEVRIPDPNGGSPDNYRLVRTWTATDSSNQVTSYSQTITVEDKEPPSLALTIDPTVTAACDNTPEVRDYAPFIRDNCDDGAITIGHTETSVENGCAEDYTVTHVWSMSDRSGNSASFQQVVHVVDDRAPKFVGLPMCVQGLENDQKAVFPNFIANHFQGLTTDNCAQSVSFGNAVTCNSTDTSNAADCSFSNGALNLYSRNYNTDVATFNVYATATDGCGHSATLKQQIVVPRAGAYAFAGVNEADCAAPSTA